MCHMRYIRNTWSTVTLRYLPREVIVLSCVRANRDGRLGFLTDRRRLNVALSRARRALVVLGDRATLEHDATWAAFFEYVDEHRLEHGSLDAVLWRERGRDDDDHQRVAAAPPTMHALHDAAGGGAERTDLDDL